MENTTHTGIVPRITSWLFGERAARLTERASRAHWLSYLLVLSQSIAVVLVLGHAELPLLFGGSWAIRALASMGLFVLIATIFASDLALLETLRRIPVLARNRQRAQHREHVLYVAFVIRSGVYPMVAQVPVIRRESREAPQYEQMRESIVYGEIQEITPCVSVGKWDAYREGVYHGATSYEYGIPVFAYASDGRCVFSAVARAHDVYDPERINKLGRPGAYVPTRPSEVELQAVIDRAVHALEGA